MIASSRSLYSAQSTTSEVTSFGIVASHFAPVRCEAVPLPGQLGKEIRVLERETARAVGQAAELLVKSSLYFSSDNREALGGCPYDLGERLNRLESAARVRLAQWGIGDAYTARLRRLLVVVTDLQTTTGAIQRTLQHLELKHGYFLPPAPCALLRKPSDVLTRLMLRLAVAIEQDSERAARDLVHQFIGLESLYQETLRELKTHAVYLSPALLRVIRGTLWSIGVAAQAAARIAYRHSLPAERAAGSLTASQEARPKMLPRKAGLAPLSSDDMPRPPARLSIPVFSSL